MCLKPRHAIFQWSSARETFSKLGLNGGVGKMCIFNRKLAISQKWWEAGPRLLLITNRNWHTPCQIEWKSSTLADLLTLMVKEYAIVVTFGLLILLVMYLHYITNASSKLMWDQCTYCHMWTEARHLGAAVWARPLSCSPFGCWDVWGLRTFGCCRLGATVLALCRVIAVNVQWTSCL